MNADLELPAGVMDRHIARVDRLRPVLRACATAGSPLDHLAYGLVGQAFAVVVSGAAQTSSQAVAALADHLDGIADGLNASRAAYTEVEQANTHRFRSPR